MRLERIELENFRGYKKKTFQFGEHTVVVAPNGVGKTNLLEAIYLLASGTSFRTSVTDELVAWGAEYGRVTGIVEVTTDEIVSLGVVLTRGSLLGRRTQKRRYLVDGAPRLRNRFAGRLAAVIFRPEDMRLVEGSPPRRRQYLDEVLGMVHPDYAKAQDVYDASLRRRNRLLDMIREGEVRREQLAFWDQSIVKNGTILSDYRRAYLNYLSGMSMSFGQYRLEYVASPVTQAKLDEHYMAEVSVGHTLVGPHKDDFRVMNKALGVHEKSERDLMIYGSRGEQRLGVLYLKLGSMKYVEEKMHLKPILLLDDIFSELDEEHRREVLKMSAGHQTILTTAEEDVMDQFGGEKFERLEI